MPPWRPWRVASLESCPPGELPAWRVALQEGYPPGELPSRRGARLESYPPGGPLHWRIVSWSTVCQPRKNLRISEFSGGCLFEKIEWGPPLKTEKLLWVMKKTEKARIEWGGSHSILATGARRNPELRGGSHSILSKRGPFRGSSQFPFYLFKKAALEGRLPFYPGYRWNPEFVGSAFLPG